MDFLTETLDSNYQSVNNIFIFLHELIWWGPNNEYQDIGINYLPHYPGSSNFDTIVKPLLESYPNNITLYAGDLWANSNASAFMYDQFNNITLIGSGMGKGYEDNIVITEVYTDSIYYNLIELNSGDPKSLGELDDFTISIEELILKIEIFLKRSQIVVKEESHLFKIGDFTFDHKNLQLKNESIKRQLTQKEADLLKYFIKNKNVVLKRSDILETLWGEDDYFLGRSLDVFISRLRKYLKEDETLKIENIHGVGFRFNHMSQE